MSREKISELYNKIYQEALESKELLFDMLSYLGFEFDNRVSNNKYFYFKVPYAEQKTGSLNVFMDKRSNNWLFHDFLSDWSGNIFTLLEDAGFKQSEKINFLLKNYRDYFSLSDDEVSLLLEKNTLPRYKEKELYKISKEIKKKSASTKINKRESNLPKILYANPIFASLDTLEKITKTIKTDKGNKDILIYKDIIKHIKENRKIDECEFLVTNLILKDKKEDKVIGYNSAVAVPFGMFDYDKLKAMNSDELKNVLYKYGAELRLVKEIEGLKSYTKVGFDNPIGKCPTFFKRDGKNLAVFESVFDYLSVSNFLDNDDILIMNGASMVNRLSELLKANDFFNAYEKLKIFQQNDLASERMVFVFFDNEEIKDRIKFEESYVFKYKKSEEKMDINDLIKNNKIQNKDDLEKRLLKTKFKNPLVAKFDYSVKKKMKK